MEDSSKLDEYECLEGKTPEFLEKTEYIEEPIGTPYDLPPQPQPVPDCTSGMVTYNVQRIRIDEKTTKWEPHPTKPNCYKIVVSTKTRYDLKNLGYTISCIDKI